MIKERVPEFLDNALRFMYMCLPFFRSEMASLIN